MTSDAPYNRAQKHVTPRRIWQFIYEQVELRIEEQRHLNSCMRCAEVFRLCVICETWEQVLKELQESDIGMVA
jgi:hypothetical protein